jgi:hypothetical protein
LFADGFGMRPPVEGTISRGNVPYQFKGQPELAGKLLKNPLVPNVETTLALGKDKYDIYCSPCHGYFGEGRQQIKWAIS